MNGNEKSSDESLTFSILVSNTQNELIGTQLNTMYLLLNRTVLKDPHAAIDFSQLEMELVRFF